MRKLFLTAIVLCMILCACGKKEEDLEKSKYTEYPVLENVHVTLSSIEHGANQCMVTFEIQNNAKDKITWGTKWRLELLDGEWYTINFKEGSAWEDYSLSLDPEQKQVVEVDLQDYFDLPLSKGTYRLVQAVKGQLLSVTFEIN